MSFLQAYKGSLYKVVVDATTSRVLGVHIVDAAAGEIIQGVAIAVKMGAKISDFYRTIGVHPTSAEELVRLCQSKNLYRFHSRSDISIATHVSFSASGLPLPADEVPLICCADKYFTVSARANLALTLPSLYIVPFAPLQCSMRTPSYYLVDGVKVDTLPPIAAL